MLKSLISVIVTHYVTSNNRQKKTTFAKHQNQSQLKIKKCIIYIYFIQLFILQLTGFSGISNIFLSIFWSRIFLI